MRRGSVRWRGMVVLVGVLIACLGGFGGWLGWRYWGVWLLHADYAPPPPPERTVYFDPATYRVSEGGTIPITVLLSSAADEPVSVDYQVVDARGNILDSGTITFAPGETIGGFIFTAPSDSCANGDTVAVAELLDPRGGNTGLGDPWYATITIVDDDTYNGTYDDGC